eukprot:augustus_masked-scaffold_56-processed-gene-1.83-mRNA-1 protein AED:1.00 eAED:1.00 QI:0/0/0/0/1/1/3/0/287
MEKFGGRQKDRTVIEVERVNEEQHNYMLIFSTEEKLRKPLTKDKVKEKLNRLIEILRRVVKSVISRMTFRKAEARVRSNRKLSQAREDFIDSDKRKQRLKQLFESKKEMSKDDILKLNFDELSDPESLKRETKVEMLLPKNNENTRMKEKEFMFEVCLGEQKYEVKAEFNLGASITVAGNSNRIFEEIETLSPDGRYLKVFARTNNLRLRWVSLGNEFGNRRAAETGCSVFREGIVAQVPQQLEGSPVELIQRLSVEPGGAGRLAGELKILLEENSEELKPENDRRK